MCANSQAAYVKLIRNVYGTKSNSYQVKKILWLGQVFIKGYYLHFLFRRNNGIIGKGYFQSFKRPVTTSLGTLILRSSG